MVSSSLYNSLLGLAFVLSPVFAQTFTSCNPLQRTDCPINEALGTNATFKWNETEAYRSVWNITAGRINYNSQGAEFSIKSMGDSPTIQSNFYLFFGRVSTIMKAATGTGVVSSIVLQSEDLDEVDWELLGGNNTHVLTNYFGKGDTTSYDRAIWYPVDDPQNKYHNYTTVWTRDELQWWLDGKMIRTLSYAEASGGTRYPQTPMNVRYGIWAAGDPKNVQGVIDWGGGLTDFTKGPFTQTVRQVYVEDFTNAASYKYGDTSGNWQSIKVTAGQSKAMKEIYSPHTVAERWRAMPQATRIAIISSALGGAALLVFLIAFYCIRQARLGRKEKEIADMEWEKEQASMNAYRMQMMQGGFSHGSHIQQVPKAWQR